MNTGNVDAEKYVCGVRVFMQIDILKRKKNGNIHAHTILKKTHFMCTVMQNLKNKPVLPLTFKWKKSKYK